MEPDPFFDFPAWLAAELQRRGISYRMVGQLAGLDHTVVWRILNGSRDPRLSTTLAILRALRYRPSIRREESG